MLASVGWYFTFCSLFWWCAHLAGGTVIFPPLGAPLSRTRQNFGGHVQRHACTHDRESGSAPSRIAHRPLAGSGSPVSHSCLMQPLLSGVARRSAELWERAGHWLSVAARYCWHLLAWLSSGSAVGLGPPRTAAHEAVHGAPTASSGDR